MRQRVAARGGRFDIRRGTPGGTDIRVTMPTASTAASATDALLSATTPGGSA